MVNVEVDPLGVTGEELAVGLLARRSDSFSLLLLVTFESNSRYASTLIYLHLISYLTYSKILALRRNAFLTFHRVNTMRNDSGDAQIANGLLEDLGDFEVHRQQRPSLVARVEGLSALRFELGRSWIRTEARATPSFFNVDRHRNGCI